MLLFCYRYTDGSTLRFLQESCVLDPRFKSLPFVDQDDKQEIYQRVVTNTAKVLETVRRADFEASTDDVSSVQGSEVPGTSSVGT